MKAIGGAMFFLLAIAVLIGAGVAAGRLTVTYPASSAHVWAVCAFLFGASAGISEILSRYRDEPLLAATTAAGLAYIVINGAVALAAYAVLRAYPDKIFPDLRNDLFLTSVAAGFGAMAIFRSKLFTFRSPDGKEYPIGPAIVLDTVLKTVDQKIDRRRAVQRQARVVEKMSALGNFDATAKYIEASLLSFQNLSQEQKKEITDVIQDYRTVKDWPDSLKTLGLGFAFLNIAGEENFDEVVGQIKSFIATYVAVPTPRPAMPPASPPPTPPAAPMN